MYVLVVEVFVYKEIEECCPEECAHKIMPDSMVMVSGILLHFSRVLKAP